MTTQEIHSPKQSDAEKYDLRPHQVRALNHLANGKILWGGVGTGKSRVAAAYYAKNEAPKRVYVITTAKKRDSFDWQEEFYRIGIGPLTGSKLPESSVSSKGRGKRVRSSLDKDRGLDGAGQLSGSIVPIGSVPTSSQDARLQSSHAGRDRSNGSRDLGGEWSKDNLRKSPHKLHEQGFDQRADLHNVSGRPGGSDEALSLGSYGEAGSHPWVLTVDSWNNIAKYADVAGAFFIFDEQRLVGSGDWTRKFLRIAKRNNWILLSGTPGDTWMDYIPVFVANDFYKNRSAFKREHVVYNTFTKFPKVDRYIGVGKLLKHRASLLVDMPYERHTKRQVVEVPLEYDKEALEVILKKRWNIYENRPLRDVAEMFSVGRRLVNSDPSRLAKVRELWAKHPKLIIFYNFNYELEILRTLSSTSTLGSSNNSSLRGIVPKQKNSEGITSSSIVSRSRGASSTSRTSALSSMASSRKLTLTGPGASPRSTVSRQASPGLTSGILGEWNGHKHEPIPVGDRWVYLVQYTAGAEGWNCIETDATVMYSRNYSWKILEQSMGRTDRLNTPFETLWYYDLMTNSFIDMAIGRALKAKETFNEAKYAQLFRNKELVRV